MMAAPARRRASACEPRARSAESRRPLPQFRTSSRPTARCAALPGGRARGARIREAHFAVPLPHQQIDSEGFFPHFYLSSILREKQPHINNLSPKRASASLPRREAQADLRTRRKFWNELHRRERDPKAKGSFWPPSKYQHPYVGAGPLRQPFKYQHLYGRAGGCSTALSPRRPSGAPPGPTPSAALGGPERNGQNRIGIRSGGARIREVRPSWNHVTVAPRRSSLSPAVGRESRRCGAVRLRRAACVPLPLTRAS